MTISAFARLVGCSILAVACCGCQTTPRGLVERNRHRSTAADDRLEAARDRIVRQDREKEALRQQLGELQDQLARREEAHNLMQTRLTGAKREGERLQTELASAVLSGANPTTKNAVAAEHEPFRLPAGLVGRLNQLTQNNPQATFDKQLKVVRLPGELLFGAGDALRPQGQAVLTALASALTQPDSRRLKLLVAVQVDSENRLPRDLERQYPTDWHLAAHQGVAVHQFLEQKGVPSANVGVTVQQYPAGAVGGDRSRVEVYLNEPDVNIE
jgi:hypothetical protein